MNDQFVREILKVHFKEGCIASLAPQTPPRFVFDGETNVRKSAATNNGRKKFETHPRENRHHPRKAESNVVLTWVTNMDSVARS